MDIEYIIGIVLILVIAFWFSDAFVFPAEDKLKFEPNDKQVDIYRERYPSRWMADAMEFETLSDELNNKYKVKLNKIWDDGLTLG